MIAENDFIKLTDYLWEIPSHFRENMRVPARVYASLNMLQMALKEGAIEQLLNMTTLPGIKQFALAMPDIHQGYGFPIGGVAAISEHDGVISPGGVGYDINCGVRLLLSELEVKEIKPKLELLTDLIFSRVPSGVGSAGVMQLKVKELNHVLERGCLWALDRDYALVEDVEKIESQGSLNVADADDVSDRAKERGREQLGTLGSGNHFIEIQKVDKIYDTKTANNFGLFAEQVVVLIHTGSRGLGHQICTDYVRLMNQCRSKYGFTLPDRELCSAPFHSQEGQAYFSAMSAAANFAWVNRQLITYLIRETWRHVFGNHHQNLHLLYDVSHNIAKIESYDGEKLILHRKGATRAFGPNHPELPDCYRDSGQPVIIPGSMGTASYVLAGTDQVAHDSFGSTCHGAGRCLSRAKAKKSIQANDLLSQMQHKHIVVRARSMKGLVEEAPEAYKDIDLVIEVVSHANLAKKVACLKPLAIIKG